VVRKALTAIVRTLRGITAAVRSRAKIVWGAAAAVTAFNLLAPIAVLSIARKPVDFFTFNPWLRRLPEYLASSEALEKKLSFLSNMALGWASADNGGEGIEWGFVLDVPTLFRILLTSLVFGTFFALWSYLRSQGAASEPGFKAARPDAMVKKSSLLFDLRIRGSHLHTPSPAPPESSASQCSQNAIRTAFLGGKMKKILHYLDYAGEHHAGARQYDPQRSPCRTSKEVSRPPSTRSPGP